MIKEKYLIKPISYAMAMRIIIENHYLHRKCPCSYSFGLFEGENIRGVIIYGTPSSAPLRGGICGLDEKNNVIELTRLWVCNTVGKNGESFLIGNTIPLVDKEIIVSYAENQQGHLGVVYQATNWIYTGLSAKRTNWTIEGNDKHCQTIADKYTSAEIREKYGDKFSLVDRPRKHRYVYFNCSKTRKRQLLKKLKYKIEAYPKNHYVIKKVTKMRIEIHLPDDKKFVDKLQALIDAEKRTRKNWLETQIISIVEKSTVRKKQTGSNGA